MVEENGPPIVSAPRECQLCGAGFLDFEHLRRHCEPKHGNWSEYRKRLFYEADQHSAQTLPMRRKRQQLSNFTYLYQEMMGLQSRGGKKLALVERSLLRVLRVRVTG